MHATLKPKPIAFIYFYEPDFFYFSSFQIVDFKSFKQYAKR